MGCAVPGAVIVVGLLIPVGCLQATQPDWGVGHILTATVLGVVNFDAGGLGEADVQQLVTGVVTGRIHINELLLCEAGPWGDGGGKSQCEAGRAKCHAGDSWNEKNLNSQAKRISNDNYSH